MTSSGVDDRAERLQDMGEQLGPVYGALVDELVALYGTWTIHAQLVAAGRTQSLRQ